MLVYDTVHRRTMGELTVHPWLTVNFSLTTKKNTFSNLNFVKGRCDKGPAKDIITMMREFQEENERRRVTAENNSTALVNDEENQMISQSIPNQSSESSTPIIQRKYLNSDRRINIDRNKFHSKSNKTQSDSLKVAGFFLCFNLISLSR